jgi:transposase, IS30 family
MGRPYTQLSMTEREHIELERRKGTSWADLGRLLCRPASAAWREVRRNARADGFYHPHAANRRAFERRGRARRVRKLADAAVCAAVEQHLAIGWTPALIAREVPEAGSPRTIYRAIRGPQAGRWASMLPGVPKSERLRKQKRERIHGRVMIDDRPAIVETRGRIGDWEGDTIRPVAGSQTGLLTLVERKTRLVRMALLPDRSAATLNATAARLLNGFVVHTLTVDNGMEFASHRELTVLIGAPVYFAHEHSPWERGANEQTNKLIRYFMPKGSDMAGYSISDATLVEMLLNERPRKCLTYLSPEQSMLQASLHLNWQSA